MLQTDIAINLSISSFDRRSVPTVKEGCLNWILTIEDKLAHPEGSPSAKYLPEVFLSGAVHGDERVGECRVVCCACTIEQIM